jgi:hypothetical protein
MWGVRTTARLKRGARGASKAGVADIFRGHGPAWRKANTGHVSLSHRPQ